MEQKTILIVEDDESLRDIYSMFLELENYKVLTAHNGKVALDLLQSLPRTLLPDCIILDLMMPVMDGNGLLKAMGSNPVLFKIPVIICSAFGEFEVSKQIFQIINKPLKLDDLKENIERCTNHNQISLHA